MPAINQKSTTRQEDSDALEHCERNDAQNAAPQALEISKAALNSLPPKPLPQVIRIHSQETEVENQNLGFHPWAKRPTSQLLEQGPDISKFNHPDQETIWSNCYKIATDSKDIDTMKFFYMSNLQSIEDTTSLIYTEKIKMNHSRNEITKIWRSYLAYNSLLNKDLRWPLRRKYRRELNSLKTKYPLKPHKSQLIAESEDFRRGSNDLNRMHRNILRQLAGARVFDRLSHKWDENWARLGQPAITDSSVRQTRVQFMRTVYGKKGLRWGNTDQPHRKRGWTGLTEKELPDQTYDFVTIGHVLKKGRGKSKLLWPKK